MKQRDSDHRKTSCQGSLAFQRIWVEAISMDLNFVVNGDLFSGLRSSKGQEEVATNWSTSLSLCATGICSKLTSPWKGLFVVTLCLFVDL
jgi:hypothetical protein